MVRSAKAPGQNSIGTGGQYSLGRNIVRNLKSQEIAAQMANDGAEAIGSSPDELAKALREDHARWANPVKDSGARAD